MTRKSKHTEKFQNFNLIVFGGTGDLALRKIYPALFHRYRDQQLNCDYNIIAITRKKDYEKEFNAQLIQFIKASINEDDINHDEIIEFTEKVSLIDAPESSD